MLSRVLEALKKKEVEARKNYKCSFDLTMKKKIIDVADNGLTDMLQIWFPTNFDKEFTGKQIYKVSEYSEETSRTFDTLAQVAEWIVKTYC